MGTPPDKVANAKNVLILSEGCVVVLMCGLLAVGVMAWFEQQLKLPVWQLILGLVACIGTLGLYTTAVFVRARSNVKEYVRTIPFRAAWFIVAIMFFSSMLMLLICDHLWSDPSTCQVIQRVEAVVALLSIAKGVSLAASQRIWRTLESPEG